MFQERYNRIVLPFFFFMDLFIVSGFYYFSHMVFNNSMPHVKFFFFLAIIWALPAYYFKSYRVPRVHSSQAAIRPTVFTWCFFFIIYVFFSWAGFLQPKPLAFHTAFILSIVITQLLVSIARYKYFREYRLKGKNAHYVVLLGRNITPKIFENMKQDALHYGYHFVETFLTPETYLADLTALINRKNLGLIFLQETNKTLIDEVSAFCDYYGLRLKLLLSLSVDTGRRVGLDHLGGFPIMDVRHEPLQYLGNRFLKRTVDITMALLSIVFVLTWLPFVVKLAQLVSYSGPLFFIQQRIGHDGKTFYLYKFRTMVHSFESEFAKKGKAEITHEMDTRIPWFGRLLRRTNLDEYPQFLNVLFGSMSAVGPRPHMVGEDKVLEKKVPRYRVRRFIKPGITGWAAINGYRGGTDDIQLMGKRTEYDIWYLENWTIWLDIKIMAITIWQMLTFRIPKAY